MSKINISDVEDYFEEEDPVEETTRDSRAIRKRKLKSRRRIEYLIERKKLNEMLYTEDRYWGD